MIAFYCFKDFFGGLIDNRRYIVQKNQSLDTVSIAKRIKFKILGIINVLVISKAQIIYVQLIFAPDLYRYVRIVLSLSFRLHLIRFDLYIGGSSNVIPLAASGIFTTREKCAFFIVGFGDKKHIRN